MAFLPERLFIEEHLATGATLSTSSTFTSSDLSKYTSVSMQFIYSSVTGKNIFKIVQSNDGTNFSDLSEEYQLPIGSGNLSIDKTSFSGKYIRIDFITTGNGTLTIKLLGKR